ncbi:transmembrane protein C1orf162 homolog isoform X5 [Ovis canadensis]|uniref:transmembrane protein C1orf162 homolog isoform X5 n=1 Tax=Ovis canadensis TaxID=37174 RepID=UPI0037536C44
MGSQMSEPEPNDKGPGTHPTTASAVTSAPCPSGHPSKEHLVLAFFAGVILTLLLMAFVFLIIKSFRKSFILRGGAYLCQHDFQSPQRKRRSPDRECAECCILGSCCLCSDQERHKRTRQTEIKAASLLQT